MSDCRASGGQRQHGASFAPETRWTCNERRRVMDEDDPLTDMVAGVSRRQTPP